MIEFIRPDELNSINEDFLREFPETLKLIEKNQEIRALLIKSNGKAFCVGLDLNLLKKAFSDDSYFTSVRKTEKHLLGFRKLNFTSCLPS